jgi:hypothetical protein
MYKLGISIDALLFFIYATTNTFIKDNPMPEIYTKVTDLFTIPGVLNTKIVNILGGVGPFKLNHTLYSDGRQEIDGVFFLGAALTIISDEELIDLSNAELFGTFTAATTTFNISTENVTFLLGGSQYVQATNNILFRAGADIASLTSGPAFYIRGTIVPDETTDLMLNFFGG